LVLQDRLLALDGGAAGVRSLARLQSALARPQQLYAHGDSADIIARAALYTAGIVRNHPFIDGNKRTGFIVGVLFLELNSYGFTASEEDATQAILQLAGGTVHDRAFTDWLRANVIAGSI